VIDQVFLAGLNHVLGQSAWAQARLKPFAGRQARFSMPPFDFGLAVTADGFFAAGDVAGGEPDVRITLPPQTPLLALAGQDRVMQQARVEGNAEFATELAFVLKNLRWDYEEDLSRAVGDIAAHRLAGGVRAFAGWQQQAAGNFADNLVEYATEENPLVVGHREHKMFADEIVELLEALQRTERRVERLRR
jgi:ubiquinone biosynthesis protein UbiJ